MTTATNTLLTGWYSVADLRNVARCTESPDALDYIYAVHGIAARIVDGRIVAVRIEEE